MQDGNGDGWQEIGAAGFDHDSLLRLNTFYSRNVYIESIDEGF